MFIKDPNDCPEIIAGDNCRLRELLHPAKDDLALRYSLAWACVKSGDTTWLHSMKTSEVYYILEGEGVMFINSEQKNVGVWQAIYIPPFGKQQIKNTGASDLKFLCIVDPAWRVEDEVILE